MLVSLVLFSQCSKPSKNILFVDPYHKGYEWSDGIRKGVKSVVEPAGVGLKIVYMDTKRNSSEEFIKKAALKVKKVIEEFKPDVVIASDDNASKYIIVPYYKNAKLPFVFCGLNWDASVYGFPVDNVTGMLEVEFIIGLIEYMKDHAKGNKIAFMSYDILSERKSAHNYKKILKVPLSEEVYVKTVDEWKKEFLALQDRVDMIIISNMAGIKGWNENEMKQWTLKNTKIPTGTTNDWMMKYSLMGLTKIAEEQGEWAAKTALKIISGTDPKNIAITKNSQGKLYINLPLAEKLKIEFSEPMLRSAVKVK